MTQKQLMMNELKRRTLLGQRWPSLAFALYNVYTVLANLLPRPPQVAMQTGCLRCQPRELLSKLRKRRTPGPSRFFTKREYSFAACQLDVFSVLFGHSSSHLPTILIPQYPKRSRQIPQDTFTGKHPCTKRWRFVSCSDSRCSHVAFF